ncbi:MAG: HAD-IA family hydrolase [Deltaproteobacteria bacterium]|nr:HAD-IA family hydrolase [Deltaproteobacteria bacterium]
MSIKGILFDLDMTLVDFMTMKKMATAEAATAMIGAGLRMDLDRLRDELFDFYMDYGIEGDYPFTEFLKLHGQMDDSILAAGMSAYHRVKSAFLEPYPRVIPTFIHLIKQGIKLGIVTDAPNLKAHQRLYAMKLTFFFDAIVTEAGKPAPDGFLKAVQILGLQPGEVLMVGDWPEKDIAGARSAGLKSCLALYGQNEKRPPVDVEPDFKISRIDDLLQLI